MFGGCVVFIPIPIAWDASLTPPQDAIKLFKIKKSLYIPHRERPAEFDAEMKSPQFLA
jgi:hypothetical protein